jgi:alpha-pyrone synthase
VLVSPVIPRITALSTATPDHDIHTAFVGWAEKQLSIPRERALFSRMVRRCAIDHRWSVLAKTGDGGSPVAQGGFYEGEVLPGTAARMDIYAKSAPELAMAAINGVGAALNPPTITHLVVASCTGFVAPGIDQLIAARLGLADTLERVLIGFMGCYAAVTALRTARHIVRSEPAARVLVVTVELSTLHLQPANQLESLLAMLHFGDGAAAAIVETSGAGLTLGDNLSIALPCSEELIRWNIGDQGFAMHLSGEVPHRIEAALVDPALRHRLMPDGLPDALAIHAGGRTILDAVETGLGLEPELLAASRNTLGHFGNMSSSTLMFTLAHMLETKPKSGLALAFGPGLAIEGFHFGACNA